MVASYVFYVTDRPQNNFQIEGNHFRGKHELKFGFGYRKASVASQSGWPGGVLSIYDGYPDILVQFTRDQNLKVNGKYTSAFLGDQISMNRLTINAGLRWDHQASSIEASHLDAIAFPFAPVQAMLGALDGPAMSNVVVWNSVTPRVGVTYALNESRKTILRGSYAMFASQLNATQGNIASQLPATSTGSGYVYWLAEGSERRQADPAERAHWQHARGHGRVRSDQSARRQRRQDRRLQSADDARAPGRDRARAVQEHRHQRQRDLAQHHELRTGRSTQA